MARDLIATWLQIPEADVEVKVESVASPIRTGNPSARCAVIAASTADLGEANAATTPSPVWLKR